MTPKHSSETRRPDFPKSRYFIKNKIKMEREQGDVLQVNGSEIQDLTIGSNGQALITPQSVAGLRGKCSFPKEQRLRGPHKQGRAQALRRKRREVTA
jgi:hypothetical protein